MQKLKEEKEKQAAMEERWRAARGKRKLKGHRPAASDSGEGPRANQEGGRHWRPQLG